MTDKMKITALIMLKMLDVGKLVCDIEAIFARFALLSKNNANKANLHCLHYGVFLNCLKKH